MAVEPCVFELDASLLCYQQPLITTDGKHSLYMNDRQSKQ